MSVYGFLESCLNTARTKYQEIVDTPRARGSYLTTEVKDLMCKVNTALSYGEITTEQAKYLLDGFKSIDFDNVAKARAAKKEGERNNVRNRFNY